MICYIRAYLFIMRDKLGKMSSLRLDLAKGITLSKKRNDKSTLYKKYRPHKIVVKEKNNLSRIT